jgi:zinc and cadmium transporter
MAQTYLYIALAVVMQGLAGLTGGMMPELLLHKYQSALVAFAAGAMISAAFLDVFPDAVSALGRSAFLWGFVGFVALALLEWRMGRHHHHGHHDGPSRSLGLSLLASDALHNVGDGAAMAAAFLVSPEAGLTVALAVAAHEIPHELGDYAILRHVGFGRWPALLALGSVQLMSGVGALAVIFLAQRFDWLVSWALAVAGGSFLYIGATDLLPELHSGTTDWERRIRVAGLAAGVALIALMPLAELAFGLSGHP